MTEEMKVLIDLFGFLRAMAEAQNLEPEKIDGEWTMKKKKKSSRTTKETTYTPIFLEAMKIYPPVENANKSKAFSAWMARIKEGEMPETMLEGTKQYAKYIATSGRIAKLPATFYGPHKHYNDNCAVLDKPNKEEKEKIKAKLKREPWAQLPDTLSPTELAHFAITYGYPKPPQIIKLDDITSYKGILINHINERIANTMRG